MRSVGFPLYSGFTDGAGRMMSASNRSATRSVPTLNEPLVAFARRPGEIGRMRRGEAPASRTGGICHAQNAPGLTHRRSALRLLFGPIQFTLLGIGRRGSKQHDSQLQFASVASVARTCFVGPRFSPDGQGKAADLQNRSALHAFARFAGWRTARNSDNQAPLPRGFSPAVRENCGVLSLAANVLM